jgi:hypothetical protein
MATMQDDHHHAFVTQDACFCNPTNMLLPANLHHKESLFAQKKGIFIPKSSPFKCALILKYA